MVSAACHPKCGVRGKKTKLGGGEENRDRQAAFCLEAQSLTERGDVRSEGFCRFADLSVFYIEINTCALVGDNVLRQVLGSPHSPPVLCAVQKLERS